MFTINCGLVLSEHGWVMGSTHRLTEANIWSKFNENPSRGKGELERTRNSKLKLVTFNCDLDLELWILHIVSLRQTFDYRLMKIFPEDRRYGADTKFNMSRHGCVIGSAHRLTKRNIWLKFNENLSKGSGDMERTRKCYGWTDGRLERQTFKRKCTYVVIQSKLYTYVPIL